MVIVHQNSKEMKNLDSNKKTNKQRNEGRAEPGWGRRLLHYKPHTLQQ